MSDWIEILVDLLEMLFTKTLSVLLILAVLLIILTCVIIYLIL